MMPRHDDIDIDTPSTLRDDDITYAITPAATLRHAITSFLPRAVIALSPLR